MAAFRRYAIDRVELIVADLFNCTGSSVRRDGCSSRTDDGALSAHVLLDEQGLVRIDGATSLHVDMFLQGSHYLLVLLLVQMSLLCLQIMRRTPEAEFVRQEAAESGGHLAEEVAEKF
jgi:hypothetical protein